MRADEFGRVEGREKIWEKWGDSLKRLENSGTGRITLYNYHFYREEILWNYILRSSTTRYYMVIYVVQVTPPIAAYLLRLIGHPFYLADTT